MTDETPRPDRRSLIAGMALLATAKAWPARAEGSAAMKNVVLLGDSIFDNKSYVGAGPDVVTSSGRPAVRLDRDARCARRLDHRRHQSQLNAMPQDATHLVVSVGGNNALGEKAMIEESARSVAEVLDKLAKIKAEFAKSYGAMLDGVLARKLPAAVCTIYEARYQDPTTREIAGAGLTVFNDVIMREAFARGMPVIDLRLVFDEDATTPTTSSLR